MNGNQQIDLNNVADCIKEVSGFGQNTYWNICNGSQHIVPWGSFDWFTNIIGTIMILGVITFLVRVMRY